MLPNENVKAQTKTTLPVVQTSNPLITFNMTMDSPKKNITYTNTLLLSFEIQINSNLSLPQVSGGLWVFYRIDNNSDVGLSADQSYYEFVDVSNLTNGIHQLTISAQMDYIYNNTIVHNIQELPSTYFSVRNLPPSIHILSPQNKIYNTDNISMIYLLNDPSTFDVSSYRDNYINLQEYSLDNKANQTIVGNGTLTGLSDGRHSLIFYAKAGVFWSHDSVIFFVDTSPVTQKIELITIAIITIISIVAVISTFLYKRHRKTH